MRCRSRLGPLAIAAASVLYVACGSCAAAGAADPAARGVMTVEVFANSAMLVTPAQTDRYRLVVHRMDRLQQIQQYINQQIPRGGEAVARRWMMANQVRIKREITPAAVAAANAINLARYYRIDHLPAVVIDRQAVVYGVTDADQAVQLYLARRRSGGRS